MVTAPKVAGVLFTAGYRARRPGDCEGYHCNQKKQRIPGPVRGKTMYQPVGPVLVQFQPKFEGVLDSTREQIMLDEYLSSLRRERPTWTVVRLPHALEVS